VVVVVEVVVEVVEVEVGGGVVVVVVEVVVEVVKVDVGRGVVVVVVEVEVGGGVEVEEVVGRDTEVDVEDSVEDVEIQLPRIHCCPDEQPFCCTTMDE
jgi:hypothetical protein